MKLGPAKTLGLASLLLLSIALQACGHGGTEVGNPPGPQVPGSEMPGSAEDGASPSPSPSGGAQIHFEAPQDINQVAPNPEEMEP